VILSALRTKQQFGTLTLSVPYPMSLQAFVMIPIDGGKWMIDGAQGLAWGDQTQVKPI
jgi:hypothetical protein